MREDLSLRPEWEPYAKLADSKEGCPFKKTMKKFENA